MVDALTRRCALRTLLASALVALVVPACGDSPGEGAGDRVTLRVATLTSSATPRRQLNLQSGAFDGTAYDIEWVDFASSKEALEALAAGAVDVGLHMQAPVALVSAGNADPAWTTSTRPFAIVGATTIEQPAGNRVLVRPDSPVTTLTDLKGAKIGMSKGGLSQYFLLLAAEADGLTDFEPVYLPPTELASALTSGAVDAVAGGVNLISLLSNGEARSIRDSIGMYDELEVHLARNAVLGEPAYESAITDLLARNERFNAWARDHQSEVAALHSALLGYSAEGAVAAAERFWGVRLSTLACRPLLTDIDARFLDSGVTAMSADLDVVVDDRFDTPTG